MSVTGIELISPNMLIPTFSSKRLPGTLLPVDISKCNANKSDKFWRKHDYILTECAITDHKFRKQTPNRNAMRVFHRVIFE